MIYIYLFIFFFLFLFFGDVRSNRLTKMDQAKLARMQASVRIGTFSPSHSLFLPVEIILLHTCFILPKFVEFMTDIFSFLNRVRNLLSTYLPTSPPIRKRSIRPLFNLTNTHLSVHPFVSLTPFPAEEKALPAARSRKSTRAPAPTTRNCKQR